MKIIINEEDADLIKNALQWFKTDQTKLLLKKLQKQNEAFY